MGDSRPRARENCAFYPACYIIGDCEHDGWKSGNCGLSAEDKAEEQRKFRECLELNSKRLRLLSRVQRGEFDHLDAPTSTDPKGEGM